MNIAEQQQRFADWTRDYSAIAHHLVNGFAAGADALEFSQSTFAAAVLSHAQQVGSDVVIAYDPQDTVTLHNMLLANLHTSDFHIV